MAPLSIVDYVVVWTTRGKIAKAIERSEQIKARIRLLGLSHLDGVGPRHSMIITKESQKQFAPKELKTIFSLRKGYV